MFLIIRVVSRKMRIKKIMIEKKRKKQITKVTQNSVREKKREIYIYYEREKNAIKISRKGQCKN